LNRKPIGLSVPHRKVENTPTHLGLLEQKVKDLTERVERLEKQLEKKS
jgi:hypothetical protein